MRVNISRNQNKILNLPDFQETVSNFSRLWYSREHSGKWMIYGITKNEAAYRVAFLFILQTLSFKLYNFPT